MHDWLIALILGIVEGITEFYSEKPAADAPAPWPKPEPTPVKQEAPAPIASESTAPKAMAGRVDYNPSRGYVITNDNDFGWHRCEVRLPNGKFFTFNGTAIDGHRQYNIRDDALVTDVLAGDAYVMQGYAQLRCDEGRKYILVTN